MRDYSKVSPQFWIGSTGKKLRKAGVECQLVSLYLMTCSHANMLGLYYLPKMYIAHECGLTLEGACKGLQSSIEAGFCSYDDDSEMVWVHEMALYQIDTQLKEKDKRVLGVQNEYDALPECPFLKAFYDKYHAAFLMINARGIKAPLKPLTSQEQEQEQEQEQKAGTGTGLVAPGKPGAAAPESETELQSACKLTWQSYCDAYFIRYQAEPVRNAKVNSQIKGFVQRIGYIESPAVAAHFVENNSAFYLQRMHSTDILLKDAEKLRTEWATGKVMTATRAKQIDQTQANSSVASEAMQILQAQGVV